MDLREILSALGGQIAQEIRLENHQANAYVHAVGRLMSHAARWSQVSASGICCETRFQSPGGVQRCGVPAISACVACGHPTCFEHSMVSPRDGTVVCFGCVGQLQRTAKIDEGASASPPGSDPAEGPRCSCPHPFQCDPGCPLHGQPGRVEQNVEELRRDHLKTLGLAEGAGWAEVQAAYKRLARRHHPDRCKSDRGKAKAHRKMAQINVAYSWLSANREAA